MSRYIDADAILKAVECHFTGELTASEREKVLADVPTIDAVSVVRCKDCKYGEYRADYDDYECNASGCGLVYDAEFYCADGERKESE